MQNKQNPRSSLQATLDELFEHSAGVGRAREQLLDQRDEGALAELLVSATTAALDEGGGDRLERLAELLSEIPGQSPVETLFNILGSEEHEEARIAAGEALVEVGTRDFALLRKVAHLFLAHGQTLHAASGLADVLAEIPTEEGAELLMAMLDHKDARVVVASLEVAGELSWNEEVLERLTSLTEDRRTVDVEDEREGQISLGIGELAAEVLEAVDSGHGRR